MAAGSSDGSAPGQSSLTAAPAADGATVGELLRAARERQGLTLEQVSRDTKIPRKHLEAIEHDHLAALPGPFYQRAQVRTYARAVKLDPNLVVARLEGKAPPPAVAANPLPAPARPATATRSRHHRVLLASGLVLTAFVFWRAMPRYLALNGSMRVADASEPNLPSSDTEATEATTGIERSDSAQVPQPATFTESTRSVDVDPSDDRTTAVEAAQDDVPIAPAVVADRAALRVATELVVATEPAGARVTVDGIGWGLTPVTIRYLPAGSKRIRVSKDGYAATELVVQVNEGERKTTDIRLRDQP
jgi:cytoskeletal protein RodZ